MERYLVLELHESDPCKQTSRPGIEMESPAALNVRSQGPKGSARLAQTSGAKAMIAYHYGTFDLPAGSYGGCDPDDSLPYIVDLKAKFLKPDPGEIIKLPSMINKLKPL